MIYSQVLVRVTLRIGRNNIGVIRRCGDSSCVMVGKFPRRLRQRLQGQRRRRDILSRLSLPSGKVYLSTAGGAVVSMPVFHHGPSDFVRNAARQWVYAAFKFHPKRNANAQNENKKNTQYPCPRAGLLSFHLAVMVAKSEERGRDAASLLGLGKTTSQLRSPENECYCFAILSWLMGMFRGAAKLGAAALPKGAAATISRRNSQSSAEAAAGMSR